MAITTNMDAKRDAMDARRTEKSIKGKTVFSPNELNNAGEDKEYFHPKNEHRFKVPQDANDHALTPDIEVSPGNKIKTQR